MGGPLRPAELLLALVLVDECDSLLVEARLAEDGDEIDRLTRIRNDAMLELAEHARRLGACA